MSSRCPEGEIGTSVGSASSVQKPVRLALIGNVANNFYREARVLGTSGVIQATCFAADTASFNTEEPRDDGLLEQRDPAVVCRITPLSKWNLLALVFPAFVARRLSPQLNNRARLLDGYDLRVFSGSFIPLLLLCEGPSFIRPTGADLTVFPHLVYRDYRKLLHPHERPPFIRGWLLYSFQRMVFRRAYKNAQGIACSSHDPYRLALADMRIDRTRLLPGIPLAVPLDSFRRITSVGGLEGQLGDVPDDFFIIFWPARLMIRDSELHRRTGQWKASDVGLRGFAKFLEALSEGDRQFVRLVIPDRFVSPDLLEAKELARALGIDRFVLWLRGEAEEGLTRREMVPWYSRANATLDDFGVGWFGSVALEALACESPVVGHAGEIAKGESARCPILGARTASEVAQHLRYLHRNPPEGLRIGQEGREWVAENHGTGALLKAYWSLVEHAGLSQPTNT